MADDVVVEGAAAEPAPTDPGVPTPDAEAVESAVPSQPDPDAEPDFTDPAKLPAEMQPLAKRLMASYTKRMQSLAKDREKVALVDRFDQDPGFAKELIAYHAQRMGLAAAPASTAPQQPAQPGKSDVPPAMVEAARATLPSELQWMAESIAATQWALNRPTVEQQRREQQTRAAEAFQAAAEELTGKMPGWESHEGDMAELIQFMASPALRHPKFGSKLEIALNAVTRGAVATRTVTQRMADAGRQRTTTGQSGRTVAPNYAERIRGAKTHQDAIAAAAQAAEDALAAQGIKIP